MRDTQVDPELERDVRRGLTRAQKELPSKYLYDDRGSLLFERICELPEYYLTRAEVGLLEREAPSIVAASGASELVELGSGGPRKARIVLGAMSELGRRPRYLPVDVSPAALESLCTLSREVPGLTLDPVVGDFLTDLDRVPARSANRLVAFLGSTIGNLDDREARAVLARARKLLSPEDRFLLGADLVKDKAKIERAYNDAAGVTAEFNRNALRVVSRLLGGDARPETFDHVAFFDDERARIEMHLRSREDQVLRFRAIDLDVPIRAGETIRTEISRKWTRPRLEGLLASAGLELDAWREDTVNGFALVTARPRRLARVA